MAVKSPHSSVRKHPRADGLNRNGRASVSYVEIELLEWQPNSSQEGGVIQFKMATGRPISKGFLHRKTQERLAD